MKFVLPDDHEFEGLLREQLDSCRLAAAASWVAKADNCIEHEHFVGSSRDGRVWALALTRKDRLHDDSSELRPDEIVAFLVDPPKRQFDAIAEALFRVHIACSANLPLRIEAREDILCAVQFQGYKRVSTFLPEAPADWLELPAELCVSFELSEGAAVGESKFREYSRDSLEEALRVLLRGRQWGILIAYTLAVREVVPFIPWEVDWPLARKGETVPSKRERTQGVLPWESENDPSLLSIYQSVRRIGMGTPHCFDEPVLRLRAGGRTPEEAESNWHRCAKALRGLKRA